MSHIRWWKGDLVAGKEANMVKSTVDFPFPAGISEFRDRMYLRFLVNITLLLSMSLEIFYVEYD